MTAVGDAEQVSLSEVWHLLAEYGRLMDSRDAQGWSKLFAVTGGMVLADREVIGHVGLAEFAAQSPMGVHVQGVPSVTVRPDGAISAQSNFVFVNAGSRSVVAGSYHDDIERTSDGLVFARRRVDSTARIDEIK